MRSKSVWASVLTSLALLVVALRAAPARAGDPTREKEVQSDGLRKQFQWEEKVLGPKDPKQVDHAKIAALQEQARREDANRPKTPQKTVRAEGIAAPASSTLPTMDIEKPAPAGSIHYPGKKTAARAEAPKSHDAIDDFLAMNNSGGDQHEATNSSASHPNRIFKATHRKHSRSRRTRVR